MIPKSPGDSNPMEIRCYSTQDRPSCLEILASNTPEFFVRQDHDEYRAFLAELPGPYFVVEDRSAIVACGGWAMDADNVAALTWGMVRRDRHRQGIGGELLRHRLDAIRCHGGARVVRVRTVQTVRRFFTRAGFTTVDVEPNGFGPGLNRVTMELQLREVCLH